MSEHHGVKGCVNDRHCTGRYRKAETPKCRSFLEYDGIMDQHIEDIETHSCMRLNGSTEEKGRKTLPAKCRSKQCNGLDKNCFFFQHHPKSKHHKPN